MSEKNITKYIWWEKTVEYSFVRTIMKTNADAYPLDGNIEKWAGDLIEIIKDNFRLIEFKRDVDSINKENEKYGDKNVDYLSHFSDKLKESAGAKSHWLVFGELGNTKLILKYRAYLESNNDRVLNDTEDLKTSKLEDFKTYIDELMSLRGNSEGGLGGLVMADIGDKQSTTIELAEFIQLIPSLKEKFVPVVENYTSSSSPRY